MKTQKLAEITVWRGASQKLKELEGLIKAVRRKKPATIIEIGTFKGGTLWLWCQIAKPSAQIVSIDLPGGEFGGGYSAKQIKQFKSYEQGDQKIHFIRKDSHSASTLRRVEKILGRRQVDLLFIDGDHSYEGVKKDFELYSPLVRTGGLVVFHDILKHPKVPSCRVDKFWNEIKKTHRYLEFCEHEDDRGWGQWGGIGVLRF